MIEIASNTVILLTSLTKKKDEPNSRYLTLKGSIAWIILLEYYNRSTYV